MGNDTIVLIKTISPGWILFASGYSMYGVASPAHSMTLRKYCKHPSMQITVRSLESDQTFVVIIFSNVRPASKIEARELVRHF